MAKYIHKNLVKFIKSDSKRIKDKHKHLKITYILNILSTYFGWRHFNELKLNLDKSEYNQDNSLIKINKIKYKDLNIFKDEYIKFINDKFNNGTERHDHDPLFIKKGPFYRLKTIENDLFIEKVKSITLIAKKEKYLISYDLLKLFEPLYFINAKEGRETPEEAYKNNIEDCRCFDNCPNPYENGDCGGCDICSDNCYCDENKEPIDNKFDLMSWMLFSFDEIISLFDSPKIFNKKESILFLKRFENNLKTKHIQKDKTNGKIIKECKIKIQELSKSNLNYRTKIAIIFEINRKLRYGIESCSMLDGLSEVALQIFFEKSENDKNVNLFFKYDYKEFLDYISDYRNNSFDKETSNLLYLCLNNSQLLKNLMIIKND